MATIQITLPESENEVLRRQLDEAKSNLRGVAAVLRRLEQELDDDHLDEIVTVGLLSRIVDEAADAIDEAEPIIAGQAVA